MGYVTYALCCSFWEACSSMETAAVLLFDWTIHCPLESHSFKSRTRKFDAYIGISCAYGLDVVGDPLTFHLASSSDGNFYLCNTFPSSSATIWLYCLEVNAMLLTMMLIFSEAIRVMGCCAASCVTVWDQLGSKVLPCLPSQLLMGIWPHATAFWFVDSMGGGENLLIHPCKPISVKMESLGEKF